METTETCEFTETHNIECCEHLEVRRVNGKFITICDAHFYDLVDLSMSLR